MFYTEESPPTQEKVTSRRKTEKSRGSGLDTTRPADLGMMRHPVTKVHNGLLEQKISINNITDFLVMAKRVEKHVS